MQGDVPGSCCCLAGKSLAPFFSLLASTVPIRVVPMLPGPRVCLAVQFESCCLAIASNSTIFHQPTPTPRVSHGLSDAQPLHWRIKTSISSVAAVGSFVMESILRRAFYFYCAAQILRY